MRILNWLRRQAARLAAPIASLGERMIALTFFQLARALALVSFSVMLAMTTLSSVAVWAQTRRPEPTNAVEYEHRFTELETSAKEDHASVKQLADDLRKMTYATWIQQAGLSGLLGEAGIRILRVKRRKRPDDEDE